MCPSVHDGTDVGGDEGWLADSQNLCCRCSTRAITAVKHLLPKHTLALRAAASASTKRLGSALHPKGLFAVFSLFYCFVLRIMIDSPLATVLKSWLQS